MALFAGCGEPDNGGGDGAFDSCNAGVISLPTREPFWTQREAAGLVVGGSVFHSDCYEPERQIAVTVSNEATSFSQTLTASIECVQTFPTTGATQRNYYYRAYVPLAPGAGNLIEVRSGSKCGWLRVTCDPCVDPPPPPDAGPPPSDGAPPDGPAPCDFAVLEPPELEASTTGDTAAVAGSIGATGEQVFWENRTLSEWAEIPYTAGETTWSGTVPLAPDARNDVVLTATCSGGGRAADARFITQVPP